MWEKTEMLKGLRFENLKETGHLEDLHIHRKILIKILNKRIEWPGLDLSG